MQRLITICLIFIAAVSFAATTQYYGFPDAVRMKANDRILMYPNASGSRNLTGTQFKYEAAGGDAPLIKQAQNSYSSVNPNTPNSIHRRVLEVRNRTGVIMQYITAAGRMVLGTPQALAINSVSPVHGTTNLFNNYSVRRCAFTTCSTMTGVYWNGKKMTTPIYVQYNKGSGVTTAQQYIVGKPLAFDPTMSQGGKIQFLGFSTASATTYTLRVMREAIVQTDGEWTSSCGANMTDMGGYCESTFSTR